MKSAIIQGEIGNVRNELAKLMDCVAKVHGLAQNLNGTRVTVTIIYEEIAGKTIQLNETTDTYLIGDH